MREPIIYRDPGDEKPEGLDAIRQLLAKPVFLIGEVLAALNRSGVMREIERREQAGEEATP